MKSVMAGFALALVFAAGPACAQMYPEFPPMPIYRLAPPPPPPAMMHSYRGPITPEMMDDGSSSDYPTHMPGDFVANRLNRQELVESGPVFYLPH